MSALPSQPVPSDALTPSEIVQLAGHHFAAREPDIWPGIRQLLAALGIAAVAAGLSRIGGHWFALSLASLWGPILLVAAAPAYAAARQWRTGFPGRTNYVLLDGTTWVSQRRLVGAMVKAALAANARAGAITLVVEGNGDSRRVMATPTGSDAPRWHHATLEQRLELGGRRAVADIVYEWLGRDSPNPWRRALEQGLTMLRVRGVATALPRQWYQGERFTAASVTVAEVADVQALLTQVEKGQPEVGGLLDKAIASAITQRTRAAKTGSDGTEEQTPSPWLDERADDRRRLGFGPQVAKIVPVWGSLLILVAATIGAAYVAQRLDAGRLAIGTAAVTTVLALLVARYQVRHPDLGQVLWQRAAEWQQKRSGAAARGELLDVPVVPPMSVAATWAGSLALVPIVTIFVLLMSTTDLRPLLVPAAGAALWGFFKLRTRVSKSIANVVLHSPSPAIVTHGERPPTPAPESVTSPLASTLRLDILDMRRPGALPLPSAASQARLDAVRQRPITMRAHFKRGVLTAAVLAVLFGMVGWLTGAHGFPVNTTVLAAATAFGLGRTGGAFFRGLLGLILTRLLFGPFVSIAGMFASEKVDESEASPRPAVLSFVLGAWVFLAATAAVALAGAPTSPWVAWSAAATALIGVVLLLVWFQRKRMAIERAFPFVEPLQLLALRVFGSPHLADFLDLTNEWQRIGVRLRLDGPGTTGHKFRDLVNFAAGRLDKSIVEDDAELAAALADFRQRPDAKLRFPLNSIQCNNAIWKTAVDRLLERADVVVMDLASLGPQNRGVAYELGRLCAGIEVARIVLLIDDSTDRDVLRVLVSDAWAAMPANSPNAHLPHPSLRVFDMGGHTGRRDDESRADWQRRQVRTADRQRLVGLLVDASLPPRTRITSAPPPDAATIHWSSTPLPAPVRLARNVVFALILLFQVLTIAC